MRQKHNMTKKQNKKNEMHGARTGFHHINQIQIYVARVKFPHSIFWKSLSFQNPFVATASKGTLAVAGVS